MWDTIGPEPLRGHAMGEAFPPQARSGIGEHTRPRVWCPASRRRQDFSPPLEVEMSDGTLKTAREDAYDFPAALNLCSRASADDVFGGDLWEKKIEKIVGSTSLRSSARHAESAEGMARHDCTGDLAVDVKIADLKFRFHSVDPTRAAGEEAAGKRVSRAIGNPERLIEIPGINHREDRAKNFLLG